MLCGAHAVFCFKKWLGSCWGLLQSNTRHYEEIENSAQSHAGKGILFFFVCFIYVNTDNGWGHPSQSVSHRASHAVSNLGPFSRLLSHPASRLTANQPSANQLPSQPASSTSHPASQQPSSQLVIQLASEAQPSQTGSQALPNQTVSQSQPAAKMPRRDPKRTPKTSPNHTQKHATF